MDETMFDGLGDEDFDLPSFLDRLGLPYHHDQSGALRAPCSQHPDEAMSVTFSERSGRFRCSVCGHADSLQQYARPFTQLVGDDDLPVVSTFQPPARQSGRFAVDVEEKPPLEASFEEIKQGSGRAYILMSKSALNKTLISGANMIIIAPVAIAPLIH